MLGADPHLAVRLANSEDRAAGEDALASAAGLRELLAGHPAWQARATRADLEALRRARPRVWEVFDRAGRGESDRCLDLLNALLRHTSPRPRLDTVGGTPRLRLADDLPSVGSAYLTSAVIGLAAAVADLGVERLGVCEATGCRAVYLDASSGRPRRFCSPRCATRTHVAAHRARGRKFSGDS